MYIGWCDRVLVHDGNVVMIRTDGIPLLGLRSPSPSTCPRLPARTASVSAPALYVSRGLCLQSRRLDPVTPAHVHTQPPGDPQGARSYLTRINLV